MLKEFGADLKSFRESKNITIAEISSETRINPKFLLNFEAGIFDFQPDTYIRAFLREYANVVGIDEIEIIGDFERAKSGYYSRKYYKQVQDNKTAQTTYIENVSNDQKEEIIPPVIKNEIPKVTKTTESKKPVLRKASYEEDEASPNKSLYQKIFLGILLVAILIGLYFLYNYLTGSNKQNANIKPKSFDEMTDAYEQKLNKRGDKDLVDSLNRLKESQIKPADSLSLKVIASKNVRFKAFIDGETTITEGEIIAGDSTVIKAKEKVRFSASSSQSIELYLNGRKLEKPKIPPGMSLKNLKIDKNGIVNE